MSCHVPTGSTLGASRKRKDRDGSEGGPCKDKAEPNFSAAAAVAAQPAPPGKRLLAGYLAHEFLTKGTLFGRRWEPARSGPGKRPEAVQSPVRPETDHPANPPMAYVEVSYLLRTEGVHIPGVVNPTQLARWLQM